MGRKDINYARTLSHMVVSEGYRKQQQPQVWVRTATGLRGVQQLVNQQNQMLQQMQFQNQVALQQAAMTNPYATGYAPVVGLGGVPTGISNLSMGSTRYVPVNTTPTPVYPVLPKVQFQVPIE